VGVLALGLAGCDTDAVLQVEVPDLISRPIVEDTTNIGNVRNGALFEFGRAYGGEASNTGDLGQVTFSGLLADELWGSSTFTTHRLIDARNVDENNTSANRAFSLLQRARNATELASRLYTTTPRANTAEHAQMANLSGFTYIFFAENYCSGVPFSSQPFTGAAEYGRPETTEEILNRAIARFDAALAMTGSSATQRNLARVGRARALLDLGRFADAAAAAADVPTDFSYAHEFSELTTAPDNGVWYWINSITRISVASDEGGNGLRYFRRGPSQGGTNTIDPRAPADSVGTGLGTAIPQYNQRKYPTRGTGIPLATGIEARLIQAEAAFNKGQNASHLPILNQLRAGMTGPVPLTDPGNPRARVLQLYQERAFWMWLTSHRLGDLRRLIWHYDFQPDEIFPVGATITGLSYGTDVNLPVAFSELNNPNYNREGGCTSRTR
jgi:hypothetical protein